ncbi:hypothetical protein [Aquimarina sp. SS2-1]|uniref:hypothetical protein n=1 Tax=Aquimarina besae TaxID=3342247 RepID=UPI00366DB537
MTNTHYCESNDSRLSCTYHINFEENKFILVKDLEKIDTGDFEIERHNDNTFLINFYSEFNNEILKLLGSNTVKLFDEKENGFILLTESPTNLFILRKIQ